MSNNLKPNADEMKARFYEEGILKHFKQRAAAPNALPYQTQINNTLRAAMIADRGVTVEVEDESVGCIAGSSQCAGCIIRHSE